MGAEKTRGRVYIVGAGPADPGLITLAAINALTQADVVLHDALSAPVLLRHAPPDSLRINVGKRSGDHVMSQDRINGLLVEHGRIGNEVPGSVRRDRLPTEDEKRYAQQPASPHQQFPGTCSASPDQQFAIARHYLLHPRSNQSRQILGKHDDADDDQQDGGSGLKFIAVESRVQGGPDAATADDAHHR